MCLEGVAAIFLASDARALQRSLAALPQMGTLNKRRQPFASRPEGPALP